jgi:hypothetical protein
MRQPPQAAQNPTQRLSQSLGVGQRIQQLEIAPAHTLGCLDQAAICVPPHMQAHHPLLHRHSQQLGVHDVGMLDILKRHRAFRQPAERPGCNFPVATLASVAPG